jgi:hypothetical protein
MNELQSKRSDETAIQEEDTVKLTNDELQAILERASVYPDSVTLPIG